MSENTTVLIVGVVLLYLIATGKLKTIFGRADQTSASGVPPRPPGSNLTGALGAAACIGAGAAAGAPQLGVAAAPLCSALAPVVVKGVVWGAEKSWEGAKFVGEKAADVGVFVAKNTVSGLKIAGHEVYNALDSPANYAIGRTDQVLEGAQSGLHVADRGLTAAYGAAPTLVKAAAAPVYYTTHVAVKTADVAVDGTQAALRGVRAGVNAVGNFLFGGSGPPPTREQRAQGKPAGFR